MEHHLALSKNDAKGREQRKTVGNMKLVWEKWVRKWIASANGLVLVATVGGEVVGYSLNFIKDNVPVYKVRKIGYVGDLFIQKGFRGKGIGSKFKSEAFRWFRKKGMKYASICVHENNREARKLYNVWGFEDFHIEMRRKL
jgi:GNAT superfamily N-acetyltransferase